MLLLLQGAARTASLLPLAAQWTVAGRGAARRRRVRPAQARRCRAQLKTWGCRPPVGRGVTHHNRGPGTAGRMADEVWEGNLKYE